MDNGYQVLVIGGTGQTGQRLLEQLIGLGIANIVSTSRRIDGLRPAGPLAQTIASDAAKWNERVRWFDLDLGTSESELASHLAVLRDSLDESKSTVLVLSAAFTNVDGCEVDPVFCRRVNEHNTITVLDWARRELGARIAFYSSDYVFDGRTGPYDEGEPRSALQAYGRSKAAVEEWLENNDPGALILRTTGIYDYIPGSKNFLMQMMALWGEGKITRIPSDQFSNPIWARELAMATIQLLERGASGIYNVAGREWLARSEFARAIARAFGRDPELIVPELTCDLSQKAPRPLRGGLKCDKLERELGWAPGEPRVILQALSGDLEI